MNNKAMKNLFFTLIVIFFSNTSYCSENLKMLNINSDEFIFNKKDTINFSTTSYSNGKIINNAVTLKKIQQQSTSNESIFLIERAIDGKADQVHYYRIDNSGVTFVSIKDISSEKMIYLNNNLRVKFPIQQGLRWNTANAVSEYEKTDDTINIGGKEYKNCIKITTRAQENNKIFTSWFIPGLWIVKETVSLNNQIIQQIEMVD